MILPQPLQSPVWPIIDRLVHAVAARSVDGKKFCAITGRQNNHLLQCSAVQRLLQGLGHLLRCKRQAFAQSHIGRFVIDAQYH